MRWNPCKWSFWFIFFRFSCHTNLYKLTPESRWLTLSFFRLLLWRPRCIFRPDTAWLSQQYTELITLAEVVSLPITPLLLVPSNPDKLPLCSPGLLQVTACVNITWLIGCDKSLHAADFFSFFSCVFRPGVQQNALPASRSCAPALNWPLCLSLQIQIIKANAVPLCAVAMGTGGLRLPAGSVFALAGNQSASGGGDAWGRVGGDAAWRGTVEVIQRLEVHRGFVPP